MPPRRSTTTPSTADYRHAATRLNNPPAGLAGGNPIPPDRKRCEYDPRRDPQLQWAGKAEHPIFDVEMVPLHNYEGIAPAAIVDLLRAGPVQASMFVDPPGWDSMHLCERPCAVSLVTRIGTFLPTHQMR